MYGLLNETNNFAFEVKVKLGLESTVTDDQVFEIELNDHRENRVEV